MKLIDTKNVAMGMFCFVLFLSASISLSSQAIQKNGKNKPQADTYLNLQNPIHSIGASLSGNVAFSGFNSKTAEGVLAPYHPVVYIYPELNIKYSCAIKNGWGITAELAFGSFEKSTGGVKGLQTISRDTLWSNGVKGIGKYPGEMYFKSYYLGFSVKASNFVQVHRNISLQSELGLEWQPFLRSAKDAISSEEYLISDGTEPSKLVYMNSTYSVSKASFFVPDIAFSFNVLVHGKNPFHNFVFGINGNIAIMDRFHFSYKTTSIMPANLQSSGEFGWRTTSIGFHVGYQWMMNNKKG